MSDSEPNVVSEGVAQPQPQPESKPQPKPKPDSKGVSKVVAKPHSGHTGASKGASKPESKGASKGVSKGASKGVGKGVGKGVSKGVSKGGVGKVVGQEWASLIFDTMDDPAGRPAGAEGADRPGEGRLEVEAMGAGSVAFEDAFEGVTAGQAPRVVDAGKLVGPGGREVQASVIVHRLLRDRAVPGEGQVEEPTVELSQPTHRVRPSASGVDGRAPTRSRLSRWR